MSDKDDRDWFELVAGREVPGAVPAVAREAAIVRASLLAQATTEGEALDNDAAVAAARARRLRERASHEGLLPDPGGSNVGAGRRSALPPALARLVGWRPALALAVVVGLAAGVALLVPPQSTGKDPPGVLRGALPRLVSKTVPDPAAAAAALGRAIRAAGVEARVYAAGEFWYVEAILPDKSGPALVNAWQAADLPEFGKGPVRVMFKKQAE